MLVKEPISQNKMTSSIANLFTSSLAFSAGFFQSQHNTFGSGTCPVDVPLSCSNTTTVEDLCCFEYPGGVILLAQFWDYSPSIGPLDEFTLHGLWPDNCDGTFEQFCNANLEVRNPGEIVKSHDEELFEEMNHVWKDYKGRDEQLWTHEWNKHGTCYTTLKPACYSEEEYTNRVDVYDFFKAAVDLHRTLPTFKFLRNEGIVPSFTETYTKEQILGALKKNFGGFEPFVKCDRNNALNEVWYFHHLQGSVKSGRFNQIDTFNSFRCPNEGIKFIPKTSRPPRPTRTLKPGPKPTGDVSTGFVKLTNQPGCLIKNGKWYTTGSCATFTVTKSNGDRVILKSNGGVCGLDEDNKLVCSPRTRATEFIYNESTGVLATDKDNGELWSADRVPHGRTQIDVKNIIGGNIEFKLRFERRW